MPKKTCIVCGAYSEGSRCARHMRQKRPWVKSADREGYGWAWTQRRNQVLREEPNCRICGRPATEVDHIVPRAEARLMGWTGAQTEARSNLRPLCHEHHHVKTMQEAARGSRRRV